VAALSARDERRVETLTAQDVSAGDSDEATATGGTLHSDAPASEADSAAPTPAADARDEMAHADASAATGRVTAPTQAAGDTPAAADPASATLAVSATPKPAPSFAAMRQVAPATATRHRWRAPVAVTALSSLLLLQILLADRARLSMDAHWRPLLSGLCGALGCSLPPWHEPAAFRLIARDVRPHPQQPGVLRATATFRNDARWAQAWPRVVLTLSDVEGRAIGRRDFTPSEYLGGTPTENTLSSGQSAMILLDVVEPAANVVAFSFEFR
jgi:hypothetical protein